MYVADALGGSTLAYVGTQAVGTFIGSGFDYVGVGPVNIPTNGDWLGANIGNIIGDLELISEIEGGGKVSWNWQALAWVSEGGPISRSMVDTKFAHGMANYNVVYKGYEPTLRTKVHEFTHIWEMRFGGSWIYYSTYQLFSGLYGYWDNPYEVQCFNRAKIDIYDAMMGIDW
ncbi:MAG: hypothetical protein ABIN61_00455 [candidate division WOR-3 bacterium]